MMLSQESTESRVSIADQGDRVARLVKQAARRESDTWRGRLPEDLLRETAHRLALFCGVGAGTWTIGVFMANLLRPTSVPSPFPWPGNFIGGAMIVVLTAAFVYVRRRSIQDSEPTLDLGLGLLILNAFAIAVINEWVPTFPDTRYVSWNAILILVYAMIVPTTPRKMFVACLVAASMDPLAVGVANLRGFEAPSFVKGIGLYYPNYICAVIAVLPSIALYRMGRHMTNARELGSYELVERLGQGGMGEVWRAEHRLLVRPAAIKLVRHEKLGVAREQDVDVLLRRFEREAQATAALGSPHTIKLFDFGRTEEGAFYYVMELLIGRDLETLVRDFGPLPSDRVSHLLRHVCHSLAEAHVRGLVHRDIKPANVYVCRVGLEYDFVKVLDFGLVKFGSRTGHNATLSAARVTSGTPGYMAPEVILGEAEVDARADVYAIGCLAYWMLTGQRVFESDSATKLLIDHVQTAPVPPSQRTELPIPREFEKIVLACLEKDPNRRPQNAEVLWRMSLNCRSAEPWSREAAQGWWESHLPELTQPLVLAVPATGAIHREIHEPVADAFLAPTR
jgi:eukaryotic-like serine/threonine-protein kinase